MCDMLATPSREGDSFDDNTDDEEHMRCFIGSLNLALRSQSTLDHETLMFPHYERTMGNKAVPIFQQVVNQDP